MNFMNYATLPMWLEILEQTHGTQRDAARTYGMDIGYWNRLKLGIKDNPSDEVLERLGLEKTVVLYTRTNS